MKKVDIVIGGMQKGGTTSLARYLESHPAIESHPQMEMTYFHQAEEFASGWQNALNKYFFNCRLVEGEKLLLAKQALLICSKEALIRLYEHNPDVKLLITLRNPVDRAWSSFLMEVSYGESEDTFAAAAHDVLQHQRIDKKDWRQRFYFGLGLYADFLTVVYEVLPRSQVKIVFLEDLQQDPISLMKEVFDWLGLSSENFDYSVTSEKVNGYSAPSKNPLSGTINTILKNNNPIKAGIRKLLSPRMQFILGEKLRAFTKKPAAPPKLDPALRQKLSEFYAPYNRQLAEQLNKDLSFWNT